MSLITRRSFVPITGAAAAAALAAMEQQAPAFNYGTGCSAAGGSLNVKDTQFSGGAKGNGSTDDTGAIQACFNAAFGTSGSPHGTNATQNASVYFPSGLYRCGALTLTKVLGGHIFGDGPNASVLQWNGSSNPGAPTAIITTNGFENCCIANLGFDSNGAGNASGNLRLFVLDWDNLGGVGLKNNLFDTVSFAPITLMPNGVSCLIAPSGNGGSNNLFLHCEFSCGKTNVGLKTAGAGAINNSLWDCGVVTIGAAGLWASAGSISNCIGTGWATNNVGAGPGMQIDAGNTVIIGARAEISNNTNGFASYSWVNITAGTLAIYSSSFSSPPLVTSGNGILTMASPAQVILDCIDDGGGSLNGRIGGTGTLEIRSAKFTGLSNPGQNIANFTGNLVRWRLPPSTFANLPTPKQGMEAIVTDISAPAPPYSSSSFGALITAGGGTGVALARYNGTNWTIMGI
jgi:hypothetical protein